MKKVLIILGALAALLVLLVIIVGLGVAGSRNRLVSLSQNVDSQWAQVQNNYQRRADLIPNLVSTVSGAANFERSTLTAVTEARASVGKVQINTGNAPTDAQVLAQYQKAQDQLGSALSRLLVVSENYPELRATANFRDLQAQLEGTENRITVARQDFNNAVQGYNTAVNSFPAVMYAGMFGFKAKPYFSAAAGSDVVPKVDFSGMTPAAATNH